MNNCRMNEQDLFELRHYLKGRYFLSDEKLRLWSDEVEASWKERDELKLEIEKLNCLLEPEGEQDYPIEHYIKENVELREKVTKLGGIT